MAVGDPGQGRIFEDYSDISGVTEGSLVRIEEDQHGQSRKLEVTRDAGGQLLRRYFVNGELRSLRCHSLRSANARKCCRHSCGGCLVREFCPGQTGHES